MDQIEKEYLLRCSVCSDIYEHLPTLYDYSTRVESVLECGVRGVVSSWAFLYGLLNNNKPNKKLIMNDISPCDNTHLIDLTRDLPIEIVSIWADNLEIELDENVDLTFIDTWHVYGQLKRELDKFSKVTNKYIIMHDTTIDEWQGESIRNGDNIEYQSITSGIPMSEITSGLWPAIDEFLINNKDWILKERFYNCNGLTILEKVD